MLLSRALRIGPGSIVAFVGGGGKTTAMFRLAAELSPHGPVITTTTTRIFAAQTSLAPVHYHVTSPDDLPDLERLLITDPHILLTGPPDPDPKQAGKAPGLSPETFDALLARTASLRPAILVEADGSRMRPLKAPAAHEPVIPPQATHVVPVVGADVAGRPLTDEYVHRAGLLASLVGAQVGEVVTPELIAALLLHPEGGRKGVPHQARVSLLFNKCDTSERLVFGSALARRLLESPAYHSAVLGAVNHDDPITRVCGRTAGIVLAAGASRRFNGPPKQLLEYRDKPLVVRAAEAALSAGLDEVVVVVGSAGEEVRAALTGLPVRMVENPDWEKGQSGSVKEGLRALSSNVDAAIFLLADQPLIPPALIPSLLDVHRRTLAAIIAPRHKGRRGNPVLFDRATWPELMGLAGDTGGRPLFAKYAGEVEWVETEEEVLVDVDTEEDYTRLSWNESHGGRGVWEQGR